MATVVGLLLCSCTADKSAGPQSVRQRFVPAPARSSGGTGANWTALAPFPHEFGNRQVLAHAGIGDTFPVQEPGGLILFEVAVLAGDEEHLVLEIRAGESPAKKITLRRDKKVTVPVGSSRFDFCYPTVHISTGDPPTTSKAMVIVRLCP